MCRTVLITSFTAGVWRNNLRILVTGGAGYLGSHTCLELLRYGHEVHALDSLINGSLEALERVKRLSNTMLNFNKIDIRDARALEKVLGKARPDAIIHFAGLKSVVESFAEPELYFDVNVGGTAILLKAMERAGCNRIIFSSSATVYGEPRYLPCDESHPLKPINPYGRTKLVSENLLNDWVNARKGRHAVALRYFNPVGADVSGQIGEDPNGIPNNLMPLVAQVAGGRREYLKIYGDDYDTIDGTGVRDYIHVADLARAHVLAVEKITMLKPFDVVNVGTGIGLSVLQIVQEFENQSGRSVKFQMAPRRKGDAPAIWANVLKAFEELDFQAKYGVAEMCQDTWRWQAANPNGYLGN